MTREFTIRRTVAFCETDMAGVMHFSNYLRWLEDAEHAFWRSLGLSVHNVTGPLQYSWPRVAVSCEYSSPLTFEQEAELRLRITKIGTKSFEFEVEFLAGGRRAALARATTVCCDVSEGRFAPIAIPDSVRARLETWLAEGSG